MEDHTEEGRVTGLDPAAQDGLRPVESDPQNEAEGISDKLTLWALRAVDAFPRPTIPVIEPWEVSIAGLARQTRVPRIATKPLELLDRLGAIHVGPQDVGFDGKEVAWDRVTQIRMQPAWTMLTANMLKAQFEKYASSMPPIPGKGWAIRTCSSLLVSLYLAVIPPDEDGTLRLPGQDEDDALVDRLVVTEIGYRRRAFGIGGEVEAATAATVLQLLIPEATAAIVSTARARQIAVHETSFGTGELEKEAHRGAQWRKAALSLRERAHARKRDDDDDDGVDNPPAP